MIYRGDFQKIVADLLIGGGGYSNGTIPDLLEAVLKVVGNYG